MGDDGEHGGDSSMGVGNVESTEKEFGKGGRFWKHGEEDRLGRSVRVTDPAMSLEVTMFGECEQISSEGVVLGDGSVFS